MKIDIKRWWFKQKIKHDLRVEYSGSRDKSKMGKDLKYWMRQYDQYSIKHTPTFKDDTIWDYYGKILLYILLILIPLFITFIS
jgi:hypothetical protein